MATPAQMASIKKSVLENKGAITANIVDMALDIPIRKDAKNAIIPAGDVVVQHNQWYDLIIPPKTSVVSTSLSVGNQILDFEFDYKPGYYLRDPDSLFIEFQVSNSDALNTVTPTFVEGWLDELRAVEWLCDGQTFQTCPMMQVVLEPALKMTNREYTSYVSTTNHDNTLVYTSVASIAAGANGVAPVVGPYMIRVPNPFPEIGLWLGAFGVNSKTRHTLTCRLRFAPNGATSAGTGTLVLNTAQLRLSTYLVMDHEIPALERFWQNFKWQSLECVLNRPIAITLVSTGNSPNILCTAWKDLAVCFVVLFPHVARTIGGGGGTGSAYFNFLAPVNAYAKIR